MLLNMIAWYLQKHYKESIHKGQSSPDMHLHRHLLAFFKLYGVTLDQRENGLSIRRGGFLFQRDPRSEMGMVGNSTGRAPAATRLLVESPLDKVEEVSAGAYNYVVARHNFKFAYETLLTNAHHTHSLLSLVLSDKLFIYKSN
jgi:DNA polymerase sigma